MTREEAINEIRSWDFLNVKEIDAIQTLIPELRESEDERTRKLLIEFISDIKRISESGRDSWAVRKDDAEMCDAFLSYLEKQKEQKPVDYYHEMWKNCEANFEGGKKEVIEHPEKYGLQKPAEWSEDYDEENLQTRFAFYTYKDDPSVLYLSNVFVEETSRNHGFGTRILKAAEKVAEAIGAITIRLKVKQDSPANNWYRKHGYAYMTFEDGYDWLEKNLEYLKPVKQEWSEEDEKMRQSIIKDIEFERNYTSSTTGKVIGKYNEQINWLKSLPLNLKKKNEDAAKLCSNEWSDEDEEALDMCLDAIPKRWKTKSGILLTKWLKDNIRPQSKQEWSEEDRDTLLMAATVLKANFDSDEKFEDCDYDCGTLAGKLLEMRYRIGSSWKPSEEELRTLDIVITDYRHACTKGSDEKAETLKPLLEQLKKL